MPPPPKGEAGRNYREEALWPWLGSPSGGAVMKTQGVFMTERATEGGFFLNGQVEGNGIKHGL